MTDESMEVTVRYFAAVREKIGRESEAIELEAGASLEDLWGVLVERHPDLAGLRTHLRFAVDREFAEPECRLEEGAEVALIPPVAGGSGGGAGGGQTRRCGDGRFAIGPDPLQPRHVRHLVARPEAGAIVTFEGVVRNHTGDRPVEALEYEYYAEMALEKLVETGELAETRGDDLRIAIHHRYGRLEVGDIAVAIACSSPHRVAAFEACRFAIDRLKEVVPIWKKEIGPDGERWVGFGP